MSDWPHQIFGVSETIRLLLGGSRRVCLTSPTGGGKCFGAGTPILMFDGTLKSVEDVVAGDFVMGPDSRPRRVLGITTGEDDLFVVNSKRFSEPYVVNRSHVLSLKMTGGSKHGCGVEDGTIVNLDVEFYLNSTKSFRHCAKGYRVGVEFDEVPTSLDPYFLGVWLGDGTTKRPDITTADPEIVDEIEFNAARYSVGVSVRQKPGNAASTYSLTNGNRWNRNSFFEALSECGVIGNKHIPHEYKANSRACRLEILAGLIDTDGHLHKPGCYDLIFKVERLARDCAFVARSLGFSSFIRPCEKQCVNNGKWGTYWRVSVIGDVEEIPVRISRKKSPPRRQIKDHLLSGISVSPIGRGQYFGFEVDGDGLFLLGDFTVTHNSRMMVRLIEWAIAKDWQAVIYTPRKMLTEQLIRTFSASGIPFGVRAADFDEHFDLGKSIQIASPQTEDARCFKKVRWQPHNAKLVLVDEIHLQKGEVIRRIMQHHLDRGAVIVLVTATPIGVSDMADILIVAGTNSELRKCEPPALLPAYVYGCEEIDTSKIKPKQNGEFSHADIKSVWPAEIFGHVLQHWKELNPEARPSILFGPGVGESIWFAEEFCKAGYRWAHIDGEDCWLDGEFHKSNREIRDEILRLHKRGDVLGICNRFVLREGVDLPHLYHGILATPIGSMVSYVQVVGRILRAHEGQDHVIIQDHGGNWWRHGSPNQDRDWASYWSMPEHFASAVREERIRSKKEPEPIHCPKCQAIRSHGDTCPECNFRHTTKTRMVIQHNGKLKEMTGDIFKPRYTKRDPNTQDLWTQCYYRTLRARDRNNKTFREAVGLFVHENHYWPPKDLDLMPKTEADWFRACKDVPVYELNGYKQKEQPKSEPALF